MPTHYELQDKIARMKSRGQQAVESGVDALKEMIKKAKKKRKKTTTTTTTTFPPTTTTTTTMPPKSSNRKFMEDMLSGKEF